jgi:hypothetical protein
MCAACPAEARFGTATQARLQHVWHWAAVADQPFTPSDIRDAEFASVHTLPLTPESPRLGSVAATSRTAIEMCGCCHAHSNCSASLCMQTENMWHACGSVCSHARQNGRRHRTPGWGSHSTPAPSPRAGAYRPGAPRRSGHAVVRHHSSASCALPVNHLLVFLAPLTMSPLCCLMRRCGFTVNLRDSSNQDVRMQISSARDTGVAKATRLACR